MRLVKDMVSQELNSAQEVQLLAKLSNSKRSTSFPPTLYEQVKERIHWFVLVKI